ncbi:MAG: potassium-transporting ATPase subunit F [Pseudanabaena sp. M046S1SP1A06QC]|nr:potassium-transporting ATPase subunit F [Pseudanabaena sp. M046S1SP1A06QC]
MMQSLKNLHFSTLSKPKHSVSVKLFCLMLFNLIIAPAVYAANVESFTKFQAYALGLLGIATFAFSIYLFVVMFQPEKF